jgi:hypothetical protein
VNLEIIIFVQFIVVCLATLLVILFTHKTPKQLQQLREHSGLNFTDLKKNYRNYDAICVCIILFFVGPFTFFYTFLFSRISSSIHAFDPSDQFLILPSFSIWMIHALFLGTITSVPIGYGLLRYLLGKERYKEFKEYTKLRDGTDGKLIFGIVMVDILAICSMTLPFSFDYYAKVRTNAIIVSKFTGFGETIYPYDTVSELKLIQGRQTKDGKFQDPYYEIHFNDGYIWSFGRGLFGLSWSDQIDVINFISSKSGKDIQVANPDQSSTLF